MTREGKPTKKRMQEEENWVRERGCEKERRCLGGERGTTSFHCNSCSVRTRAMFISCWSVNQATLLQLLLSTESSPSPSTHSRTLAQTCHLITKCNFASIVYSLLKTGRDISWGLHLWRTECLENKNLVWKKNPSAVLRQFLNQ